MAVIECSHCKELFNEDEQFCPYCGEEADIRMAPIGNRFNKPQKGRKLVLGLPLGKWIAALIFLIAALLIVLCVYICLTLSGKVKGNDKIKDNISSNSALIENLAGATDDSSTQTIKTMPYGEILSTKTKGYNLFKCSSLGFSALIPEGFVTSKEDDNLFICQELDEEGDYTIPYLMIGKVTDFSDEIEFLQDRHSAFAKAYSDQNFSIAENLVKYEQGNKTVYEFQFKYTAQSYEILDTRRAFKIGDELFVIATKELADKTIAVSEEEVNTLIESFKMN